MADKKKETGTEIMKREDSSFAIVRADPEQVSDVIELNLGGRRLSEFNLDRVRIPDGKTQHWSMPTLDGVEAMPAVEGVVVLYKDPRGWWPDSEPTGSPPRCSSDDGVHGWGCREAGDMYRGDPANEKHLCEDCAYSKFGSEPKSGRGQWCKQMRALLVVSEDRFLPWVLFLPPTSLRECDTYFNRLAAYLVPYNAVVTRFSLRSDKNADGQTYNVAIPSRVRSLSDVERETFAEYSRRMKPAFERVRVEDDSDYHGGGD